MDDVVALMARQHGLITMAQASKLGLGRAHVRSLVRNGLWEPVGKGVLAVSGQPPTWNRAVNAALLACGTGVVASHATSARLWGAKVVDPGCIEVMSERARRIRLDGVRQHRTGLLADEDVTTRARIPCLSTARTVVELGARLGEWQTSRLVDDLLRRRVVSLRAIARCANRLHDAPGRATQVAVDVVAARWQGFSPGDSDLESRVIRVLVAAGCPTPRQQVRIERGGRRWYLDLAWPEIGLAVEIDSWCYHRFRTTFDGDRVKGNEALLLGYRLLRFSDAATDSEIVATVAAAFEALGRKWL